MSKDWNKQVFFLFLVFVPLRALQVFHLSFNSEKFIILVDNGVFGPCEISLFPRSPLDECCNILLELYMRGFVDVHHVTGLVVAHFDSVLELVVQS